jgi:hypothetical protein
MPFRGKHTPVMRTMVCSISTSPWAGSTSSQLTKVESVLGWSGRSLEQLDQVAGGVGEQDLSPSRAADRVRAEGESGSAKSVDLSVEIIDDEVDAVAAGDGRVVGRDAGTGARRAGQQQA